MRANSLIQLLLGLFLSAILVQGCASGRPTRGIDSIPKGWPISRDVAVVSSSYGAPRGRSVHQGIDLSAPAGTPVRSTADGRVIFAGRSGAFGRLIVIDHGNGWETRYAHLKRIKIEKGKKVKRGELIGTVGKSGNASGPHLHYEIRLQDRPVDPRPMM
jgi:murein DD-endopeptidase MepM/ murein hydrolase activator NlpD